MGDAGRTVRSEKTDIETRRDCKNQLVQRCLKFLQRTEPVPWGVPRERRSSQNVGVRSMTLASIKNAIAERFAALVKRAKFPERGRKHHERRVGQERLRKAGR